MFLLWSHAGNIPSTSNQTAQKRSELEGTNALLMFFWMMPTNRRFIDFPHSVSVSEIDVNKGEGMPINPFSHPFYSSKRLRLQWRDQGYKATDNPPKYSKKALQTAKPCLHHPTD